MDQHILLGLLVLKCPFIVFTLINEQDFHPLIFDIRESPLRNSGGAEQITQSIVYSEFIFPKSMFDFITV